MAGISSISDIFRKEDEDEDEDNYIKTNARLAQKILSYTLVAQKDNPSHKYNEIFYD